jgi:hypothetical protein
MRIFINSIYLKNIKINLWIYKFMIIKFMRIYLDVINLWEVSLTLYITLYIIIFDSAN